MTEIKRNLRQRHLKRRLARNSYTVDPDRVARAIIVRLAQEGPPGRGPASDPSRATPSVSRLRQAA
jgi:hypothetical protein